MALDSVDVLAMLDKIAATSSRTEKEALLRDYADDDFFKWVVTQAYDPFITFGITPPKVQAEGLKRFDLNSRPITGMLYGLQTRAITGNAAKETVLETLLSLDHSSAELLWRILSKDLRCGITATTINKVLPGTVPSFDCMLAHKFEEKRIKTWPVAVEPKLDGVRVICLVRDGKAQFFSRSGKPFPAVEHLGDQVVKMVKATHKAILDRSKLVKDEIGDLWEYYLGSEAAPAIALDGEIVSGNFNKTVGDVRRKDEAATDAEYHIFDALPYKEFTTDGLAEIKLQQMARRAFVVYMVKLAEASSLKTVPSYLASSAEEIQSFYQTFRAKGLEGAIVKPREAYYHKKRNHGWMKLKNEETHDLRVTGVFEGTGKYAGQLGGLIVDFNGVEVRVGGGFSDEDRVELWKISQADTFCLLSDAPDEVKRAGCRVIGRLIEVEAHEVTPDGSLRHPRWTGRWRDDKDVSHKEAA